MDFLEYAGPKVYKFSKHLWRKILLCITVLGVFMAHVAQIFGFPESEHMGRQPGKGADLTDFKIEFVRDLILIRPFIFHCHPHLSIERRCKSIKKWCFHKRKPSQQTVLLNSDLKRIQLGMQPIFA